MKPKRAAFFASGSGSLTQGVVESTRGKFNNPHPELILGYVRLANFIDLSASVPYPVDLQDIVEVPLIIYNKRDCGVIKRAEELKVEAKGFFDYPLKKNFQDPSKLHEARAEWEAPIFDTLKEYQIDIVGLAGWNLAICNKQMLDAYKWKMFNAHPALLPAFGGTMNGYAEALWHGVKVGGGTIHFVTSDVDEGPIILQTPFPMPTYSMNDIEKLKSANPGEQKAFWENKRKGLVDGGKQYEWPAWIATTYLVAQDCLQVFDGPKGVDLGLYNPNDTKTDKFLGSRKQVWIDLKKVYELSERGPFPVDYINR